ncbi:MAG: DNA topoisomerase IV subunit A [Candidatus Thermoplasmatota archaeon]|nr:DNA topoisomerase IV subunit A [archaeon]MBU4189604.1 DNA topoisomerase IV subunit A [Candidatus Thermoplasmatota archaeon]MBU4256060.1 DNA topoisomerase IV subunit A [Candidatus Thermoplasmatota archaeon]
MMKEKTERQKETIKKLEGIASEVYDKIVETQIPFVSLPVRTKNNIVFSEKHGVWKYGDITGTRTAKTLDGAYMLLRTMYTIDFIRNQINTAKSSTLREMYYISEGWELAKFHAQQESDHLIEDMEIMTKMMREDFKLRPEENGASIIGNITIEEVVRTGAKRKINCRDDIGDAGYTIPYNVEKEKIKFKDWDADFIIAIETGGMFDRLSENGFDEKSRAILVHLKGQPARCTRRLIKRISEECKLPVVVFTDGDPWSYRIFASVAYGAIKTAHISEYLATPSASFIGILPSDIENYKLPTDKLSDQDTHALKSELSDPRFKGNVYGNTSWEEEIKLQLELKKKSEQQALAKYGLDYVTDTYLPEKLSQIGMIK